MEKVPMTAEGHAAMMDEIKHLKSVERPRIIKAIEEARSHGDLSENAEYHAAKEQQGWTEARVAELEDKISRADVIDISKLSGETVMFGAKVTLVDEETDEKSTYQIVGEFEADVKKGKISVSSPIARAIIGKTMGDSVEVATPGGGKSYEILKVLEVELRAASTAALIFGPVGLVWVENQSTNRPSRPIRYLWKFHLGRPIRPACSPAHL